MRWGSIQSVVDLRLRSIRSYQVVFAPCASTLPLKITHQSIASTALPLQDRCRSRALVVAAAFDRAAAASSSRLGGLLVYSTHIGPTIAHRRSIP